VHAGALRVERLQEDGALYHPQPVLSIGLQKPLLRYIVIVKEPFLASAHTQKRGHLVSDSNC